MTGKYNEIMGRLELSAEARERILSHVAEPTAEKDERKGRIVSIAGFRRYAAIAACFAVVLLAVFGVSKLRDKDEPPTLAVSSMTEYSSAEELSEAMGFPVEELTALPFAPEEISYTDLFGRVAQIVYTGGDASLVFRKGYGDEDISGDYNTYEDVQEIEVGDISVSLKGSGGAYSLALWQRDGYSYSLSAEPALTEQEAVSILETLIG